MRITRIETIPILVPVLSSRMITSSRGRHSASPFLIVKVHTDKDIVGVGEVSCTPIWSGEDHTTAAHFIEGTLAPGLIGEDPRDVERLTGLMDRLLAGNVFTKSGIQMALWDILGKAARLPLYRLWGGAVRESVPLKFSISGGTPEEAAGIAEWAIGQGFRAVKVKVGTGVEADVARVTAVRQTIGPDVRLGIDANGGWNVRDAISALRRMEGLDLYFVEQPVPPDDPAWMADVRAACGVPVVADESVFNLSQAMALVRTASADVLSVYVGKGGGLSGARKMASVAEAAGITCTIGSNLELGIASAAMIHLGLSSPGIDPEAFPCDIIGPFYYERDILAEPLPLANGAAGLLENPGLGVELDDAVVDILRIIR
jgi:muconate cycloisomerase